MTKLRPLVSNSERRRITAAIKKIKSDGKLGLANSQLCRVICVACNPEWQTLEELERRVQISFRTRDSQTAISARLREVSPIRHGVMKQSTKVKNETTGRFTWFYRVIPPVCGEGGQ